MFAEAEALALRLMKEFGLQGWEFGFNRARRQMGRCAYPRAGRPGRIQLSVHYVQRNSLADIEETIRHEIAHALAGPTAGHGPAWKAMCAVTGAKPLRCGQADMPTGHWLGVCPGCQREHRRHRRPPARVTYHCRRCGPMRGTIAWRHCSLDSSTVGSKTSP
jgi:predicted SprT family Zn-dependent metalloprotease